MITVSFHSYKGGSCRTSTCFNTLPFLARKLNASSVSPLLVIDADLESQGLTYLFRAEEDFRYHKLYDAKELFSSKKMPKDFREACLPVGDKLGLEKESVYFLGVNDMKTFVAQNKGGQVDEALNELTDRGFCGIVYDTASGDQFSAGATNKNSDVLVCCMRPTTQFTTGTFSFLDRISKEWITQGGMQVRRVIVLPTAVPREQTLIDGKDQHKAALEKIVGNCMDVNFEINQAFMHQECFGIPEVARFKWCEDVLFRLDLEDKLISEQDAQLALTRYEKLADTIIEEGEQV
ncbi:MAG: hypothetical protein IJY50_06195 [Clostridia bacterium]|nr:hypothetical protein [Clostridia bacterium]